jgi:hypothetical protein
MTLHILIIVCNHRNNIVFCKITIIASFSKKRLSFRALTQKPSETMNIINPAQDPEDARLLARMVKDVN